MNELKVVSISQMPFSSLFKLYFIGVFFGLFCFMLLASVFALLGARIITVNGQSVVGFEGFISGLLLSFLLPAVFAAIFGCLGCFGHFVFTKILKKRPSIIIYTETV